MSWSHEDASSILMEAGMWRSISQQTQNETNRRVLDFLAANPKTKIDFSSSNQDGKFFEFWLREICLLSEEKIEETMRTLKLKAFK